MRVKFAIASCTATYRATYKAHKVGKWGNRLPRGPNSEAHFTFSSMQDFRKNPVPQAHVRAGRLPAPASRKTESKLECTYYTHTRARTVCMQVNARIDTRISLHNSQVQQAWLTKFILYRIARPLPREIRLTNAEF